VELFDRAAYQEALASQLTAIGGAGFPSVEPSQISVAVSAASVRIVTTLRAPSIETARHFAAILANIDFKLVLPTGTIIESAPSRSEITAELISAAPPSFPHTLLPHVAPPSPLLPTVMPSSPWLDAVELQVNHSAHFGGSLTPSANTTGWEGALAELLATHLGVGEGHVVVTPHAETDKGSGVNGSSLVLVIIDGPQATPARAALVNDLDRFVSGLTLGNFTIRRPLHPPSTPSAANVSFAKRSPCFPPWSNLPPSLPLPARPPSPHVSPSADSSNWETDGEPLHGDAALAQKHSKDGRLDSSLVLVVGVSIGAIVFVLCCAATAGYYLIRRNARLVRALAAEQQATSARLETLSELNLQRVLRGILALSRQRDMQVRPKLRAGDLAPSIAAANQKDTGYAANYEWLERQERAALHADRNERDEALNADEIEAEIMEAVGRCGSPLEAPTTCSSSTNPSAVRQINLPIARRLVVDGQPSV